MADMSSLAYFNKTLGSTSLEYGVTRDAALARLAKNMSSMDSSGNMTMAQGMVCNHPTAGIGYGTGAGGAVTQVTSKSTGVTLNTSCGQITMHNASLANDVIVSFVVTNSSIAATDVLILNHVSAGTPGKYYLNARCAAGSATIDVTNISTGSLSEAIVIAFVLIKGVTA